MKHRHHSGLRRCEKINTDVSFMVVRKLIRVCFNQLSDDFIIRHLKIAHSSTLSFVLFVKIKIPKWLTLVPAETDERATSALQNVSLHKNILFISSRTHIYLQQEKETEALEKAYWSESRGFGEERDWWWTTNKLESLTWRKNVHKNIKKCTETTFLEYKISLVDIKSCFVLLDCKYLMSKCSFIPSQCCIYRLCSRLGEHTTNIFSFLSPSHTTKFSCSLFLCRARDYSYTMRI